MSLTTNRLQQELYRLVGPTDIATPLTNLKLDFVDYAYLQFILVKYYCVKNTFVDFEHLTVGDLLDLASSNKYTE